MLIIVSDLHLWDGTMGVSVSEKTFSLFANRLRELAYQASWRAGGKYRPIETIDILLLGDILDPIQSTRWLEKKPGEAGYVRPWHDPDSSLFIAKVREITRAILANNQHAVKVFKRLVSGEAIYLPPGDKRGKPSFYDPERISPQVRIHYMIGNHDRFYYLPGPEYDAIRAEIIQALSLSNPPGPFPHGPEDESDLQEVFRRYRAIARHGDLHDHISYSPSLGRAGTSLGDIYSTEILVRFPLEIQRQLGESLPPRLIQGISRMTNVRPLMATPLFLLEQITRHGTDPAQVDEVKKIWNMVTEEFLELSILRTNELFSPHLRTPFRMLFGLSLRTSLPAVVTLSRWLRRYLSEEHISIARFANQEPAIQNGSADTVIYGHTHSHEVVALDKKAKDIYQSQQVYINTGTWATIYDYTKQPSAEQKTQPINLLTCVALYQNGERLGKRYENWWANFA